MEQKYYADSIPSEKFYLLDKLIGKKVTKMTRYSWWEKEQSAKECGISNENVFSLTVGPLGIEFDRNITIGVSSDIKRSSVILWVEKFENYKADDLMEEDSELFAVQANDKVFSNAFFASILESTLVKYKIIKVETTNPLNWDHPREVGLVLSFSNNHQMILSHQLTKEVSDDFTILEWENIDKDIYESLYKTSKFW